MTLPSSGPISFADIITEIQRSAGTTTSISEVVVRYLTRKYARLQASDASASDYFGYSVAISLDGNTLAVGSYYHNNSGGTDAGSVYIFTRSGSTWTQQARLQASDAAANDQFGYSVSLSLDGNTLAICSIYDDYSGGVDAGSVYIFTRSGSTWAEQARLQPSDITLGDAFGVSLALSADGNTLAIGSNADDNSGGSNAGSVYIFTRSGSTWTQQARLQASDAAVNDFFGSSVSISSDGNTLAVGSYRDDNTGGSDAGSAYIFTRSGSTWVEQTRLQASDAASDDWFGYSLALSSDGNTLAVGSYLDDNTGGSSAGSVYIFTRSGSTWVEQTRLQASDAAITDQFGYSVALSSDGNTLAAGSYLDNNSGGNDAGSVYIFTRSGSTWTQQTRLQANDATASNWFGYSVSISSDGNTLVVASYRDDNSGGPDAGSVYVYQSKFVGSISLSDMYGGSWLAYHETARVQASDAAANDIFGYSVSLSSDGNTLAVGAVYDNNSGGTDAGSVYIFTRSGAAWTEQARIQASDPAANDLFGYSVALSSDGNTLAIGASLDDNPRGTDAGSTYIFTRSGSTWTQQARLQASDGAAADRFGTSVSLSSDGNTLAVGSYTADNSGGTDAGSVYIFTRSGSTWTQQAKLQASDAAANDQFGYSVSLSSDGSTLAVGSYLDDNSGGLDAGSVYIFTRSGATWTEQTRLQASDAALGDQFGNSVSLSSDGNTLAVGARSDDNSGGTNAGSVYIFTRSGSTWTQQAKLQADDAAAQDSFGYSVSLSSYGNTLAVGSYLDNNSGGLDAGSVYIFTRSGATWTQQARLQASDAVASDYFGNLVSLSSDGNTLAVGSYNDDHSGGAQAGSAYIFENKNLFFN